MSGEKMKFKSVEEIKAEERLRILQLVGGSGELRTVHDVATGVDKLEDSSDWREYLSAKEMELAENRYPILLKRHSEKVREDIKHEVAEKMAEPATPPVDTRFKEDIQRMNDRAAEIKARNERWANEARAKEAAKQAEIARLRQSAQKYAE